MNPVSLFGLNLRPLLLTVPLLAAACGGSNETSPAGTPATPVTGLNGSVTKGPLRGASVQLFQFDAYGNPTGSALCSAITDSAGAFILTGCPNQPLLAVTSGGEYADEADTEPNPALRRRVTLTSAQGFKSVVPAGLPALVITPYTHALWRKAQREANGINFLTVHNAAVADAPTAFGFDPTAILPADPAAPAATASEVQKRYALLLGGAANAINSIATQMGRQPDFLAVNAFMEDLADGRVDGLQGTAPVTIGQQPIPNNVVLNDEILRFRNNNFARYQGAESPVFNESAFAQPSAPVNNPPVAQADSFSGTEDTTLIIAAPGVLSNDSDPDNVPITAVLVSAPASGTLTLNTDGGFNYTPAANNNGVVTFTYKANDSAANSAVVTVSLNLAAINDAPSFSVPASAPTVLEDAGAQSLSGFATAISSGPANESAQTLSFNLTNNNAALFSVAPAIATNGTLSYTPAANAFGSATVTVSLMDNGGTTDGGVDVSITRTFTITIAAVNDAPVITSSAPTTATEDTLYSYSATRSDADGPGTTWTVDTGDSCGGSITSGGVYTFTPTGPTPPASCAVAVKISDGTLSANQHATVTISAVNDAPVFSSASKNINENTANGTVLFLPTLAADPDGDSLTYTLTGGNTNGAFAINAGTGDISVADSVALDFETTPNFTLAIQVSDGLVTDSGTVSFVLTNVNEAPTVTSGATGTVAENAATSTVVYSATRSDPDASDTVAWSLTGTDAAAFNIGASSGQVTLVSAADFETKSSYSINVIATDGGALTGSKAVVISVTNVNEAPSVTLGGGTPTFTEDGGAVVVDGAVVLADVDNANFASATVTISNLADAGLETLSANTGSTSISASYTAPTLTLSGSDTVANYQQVLRTVSYSNTSQNPNTSNRSLALSVSDGALSGGANKTLTVTAVNDAPVLNTNTGGFVPTGGTLTLQTTNLAASDVDHGQAGVTYEIIMAPASGQLRVMGIGPAASFTAFDVGMPSVTYVHGGNSATTDNFTFALRDSAGSYSSACTVMMPCTFNISITPPNMPWHVALHRGDFDVITQTTQVRVSWPAISANTYAICVTNNPQINVNNCTFEGNQNITGLPGTTSQPYLISGNGVAPGVPVYLALFENGVLKAWTAATPEVYGTNNTVFAQAIGADGTRYVGGDFTQVDVVTGSGVSLSPSGSDGHALAFRQVTGTVYATLADGNGGFYLGGQFTSVGGQSRQNLAQVDRFGVVTAWNPSVNGLVLTLARNGNVVYVGGQFSLAGGVSRNNLAAFDATTATLTAWNPNAGGVGGVNALAIDAGIIYIGGQFSTVGGQPRTRLAAYDIGLDQLSTTWTPTADSSVLALTIDNNVIYAGGFFANASGQPRSRLAAFNTAGTLSPTWNPGANGVVLALTTEGGVIYAGGGFTTAGGSPRNRLAAFDADGTLSPTWNPGANGSVEALTVKAGVVYAGGDFTLAGGGTATTARNRLAAIDTATGNLTTWNPGANSTVRTLAFNADVIYAGGSFTAAGGGLTTRNRLAAFDTVGNLSATWNPGANDVVRALAVDGGVIYAGGDFSGAGGVTGTTTRNRLAAFDTAGNLSATWNPGANNSVLALAVNGGVIYAGGQFTSAGGVTGTTTRNRLAAFDTVGNLSATWNPGANDVVRALAVDGGVIYAGGDFSSAGGVTGTTMRLRLAAFDTAGNLSAWNPGANGGVHALAVEGGVIYAGGVFTLAGGGTGTTTRNRLAAFDTAGNLSATWNPGANSNVLALAVDGGVIYAGGQFSGAGGGTGTTTRNRLAAFDTAGNLSTTWNPGANNNVRTLAVDAGVIYAGGDFTGAGGGTGTTTRHRLAAFDTAGALVNGPNLAADLDGDGLTNAQEYAALSDPDKPDTDGDGLNDGAEVNTHGTNPRSADTDTDDVGDGLEVALGSAPSLANTNIHVSPSGLDSAGGGTWANPKRTNAEVALRLGAGGSSAANALYVLYAPGSYDPLVVSGTPRANIHFIGGLGAGIFSPANGDMTSTVFDAALGACGAPCSTVVISNATNISLRNLKITGGTSQSGNGSAAQGGGLEVTNAGGGSAAVTLEQVEISGNSAGFGGGFFLSNSSLTLKDSRVINNTANNPTSNAFGGGGYAESGSGLTISNTRFAGNTASSPSFTNRGGGLMIGCGINAQISNSVFASNKVLGTTATGGGIAMNSCNFNRSTLDLQHSLLLSNSAGDKGGGLYIEERPTTSTLVKNNLMVGNYAGGLGGGAHVDTTASNATAAESFVLINNTAAYNQAGATGTDRGGGFYIEQFNGSTYSFTAIDFLSQIAFGNNNATPAAEQGDNLFLTRGLGGTSTASTTFFFSNLTGDSPASPTGTTSGNPGFAQGFYIDQFGPAHDGGQGALFPAPFTTSVDGAQDFGQVDIGYHYQKASVGAAAFVYDDSIANLISPERAFITFSIEFADGSRQAGHKVVVTQSNSTFTSFTPSSLTTLQPAGPGSALAIDNGDGSYSFTANISGCSGPGGAGSDLVVDVQVDDAAIPIPVTYFYSPCS